MVFFQANFRNKPRAIVDTCSSNCEECLSYNVNQQILIKAWTIVHGFFQKMAPKSPPPPFLLHFLIHIDVLMLCRKFELIPTKIF